MPGPALAGRRRSQSRIEMIETSGGQLHDQVLWSRYHCRRQMFRDARPVERVAGGVVGGDDRLGLRLEARGRASERRPRVRPRQLDFHHGQNVALVA